MTWEITRRRICPDLTCARLHGRAVVGLTGPVAKVHPFLRERLRHHSPDGWEWGYAGSGPADLALAICAWVFPVGCDGRESVKLWRGRCSETAWTLHQDFKCAFIARMPEEGGDLPGRVLDEWFDRAIAALDKSVSLEEFLGNPFGEEESPGV